MPHDPTFMSRRRLMATLAFAAVPAVALAEGGVVYGPPPGEAKPKPKPKAKAPAPAAEAAPPAHPVHPAVSAEEAMSRLMAGNDRYVRGFAARPHADAPRRQEIASGQHPFAVILACADSRVAPELIFDQGLGDLFVIRVAGNVVDDSVLASIEYAVVHLGCTLVMALGHERCGAVTATADALAGKISPEDRETHIGALAALISPAVKAVPPGTIDKIDAAVSLNAAHAAGEIFAQSKPLRTRVLAGDLKIVAARYDLDDGRVTPTRTTHA